MNFQFLRAQLELHNMFKAGAISAEDLWNHSVILRFKFEE